MPEVYNELDRAAQRLEGFFCDMQDIEFTIEPGKLYILQTRRGRRSGQATPENVPWKAADWNNPRQWVKG